MVECGHVWKPRSNGIKEDCEFCGAARVIDPNRCNHEWVMRPSGKKEGCAKCGAARVVLDVQAATQKQTPEVMEG